MPNSSLSQADLQARFVAAAPFLPRTADVVITAVQAQNIGHQELADVCRAMGDDFGTALQAGLPSALFLGHLKSMFFFLHATAILATGESASWQVFSSGLSRMTMATTPATFYALGAELQR